MLFKVISGGEGEEVTCGGNKMEQQSLNYLRGQFPGRVLSNRGDQDWPARSPDLTVCDFFLWGYLIREAFQGMVHRAMKCLNVNGYTFSNE